MECKAIMHMQDLHLIQKRINGTETQARAELENLHRLMPEYRTRNPF